MNQPDHFTCACQHCANRIEFPAAGIGLKVLCPHCAQETVLTAPHAPSPTLRPAPAAPRPAPASVEPQSSRSKAVVGVVIALVLVSAAAAFWLLRNRSASSHRHEGSATGTVAASNSVAPRAPKSTNDLRVSPVTLDRPKGSGLLYAVGTVLNNSDYQRFGVKIKLELYDVAGRKTGDTKDYIQLIEPHKEWNFRAIVLGGSPVGAKVIQIEEE